MIDASVASRFLLVEDLSEKAESVLEDFLKGVVELRAPKLLVFEVGNTLWKSIKRGFVSLEEALERFSYFLDLKIGSIELDISERQELLEWGVRNDVTYYDSVYVWSCRKVGGTLLTADDVLFERSRREVRALHLKDYPEKS